MTPSKNVAILGSTGSIGQSALEVVRAVPGLNVVAISGCQNLELLARQAQEFQPQYLVAADADAGREFAFPELPGTEVLYGSDSLERIAQLPEVDIVLAAIVGVAGLPSTYAAVELSLIHI